MDGHFLFDIRRFVAVCLLGGAIAQGVLAFMFFFAANWWDMNAGVKIGIIDAVLVICAVGTAVGTGFGRAGLATAGAILSGLLFAVHGQIWQTGADAWELFAVWTLVAFIWAVLSGEDSAWTVTVIVAATAAGLWFVQTMSWSSMPGRSIGMALVVTMILFLYLLLKRIARARQSELWPPQVSSIGKWFVPLCLAAVTILLTWGGIEAMFGPPQTQGETLFGIGVGIIVLLTMPVHRFGPWPFALALIQTITLGEALIINLLFKLTESFDEVTRASLLLFAAVFMLASVGGLAVMLARLRGETALSFSASRWFHMLLSIAIGFGAWIAALTTTVALSWLLSFVVVHNNHWLALTVAVSAGIVAFIIQEKSIFSSHTRAAFSCVAYGALLVEAAVQSNVDETGTLTLVAVLAIGLLPGIFTLSRNRMTGFIGGGIAISLVVAAFVWNDATVPAMVGLAVILSVVGAVCCHRGRGAVQMFGIIAMVAAFVLPAFLEFASNDYGHFSPYGVNTFYYARGGSFLIGSGLLAAVLSLRPGMFDIRLLCAAIMTLLGSLLVPAGAAGLVGLGAMSTLVIGRPLVLTGFILAGWSLGMFYYSLALPLDMKALYLAFGALITAGAWRLAAQDVSCRPVWRPRSLVAFLMCATVPIMFQAFDAVKKEAIVVEGREILLPLYPLDPRSLVQGDYMALRYSVADSNTANYNGMAYLTVDVDGVGQSLRGEDAPPVPEADEVPIKVRRGWYRPRIAPNSFLFEEGTADSWSRARYAIVRINGEGTLVMTGLADRERIPIHPKKAVSSPSSADTP